MLHYHPLGHPPGLNPLVMIFVSTPTPKVLLLLEDVTRLLLALRLLYLLLSLSFFVHLLVQKIE